MAVDFVALMNNAVFDFFLPVVEDGLDPNRLSAEAYGAIIGKGIGCDSEVVTEYLQ